MRRPASAGPWRLSAASLLGQESDAGSRQFDSCVLTGVTRGLWLLCLYARGGLDLRHPLREGATREELAHLISTVWSMRADRGAEERLSAPGRQPLIPVAALKRDAHLEMHTRGG